MADIGARIQRVIEEMMGNEALLEMLETEAASEMLKWGIEMASTLVKRTEGLEEATAELALLPRLKAVRRVMRSVGNWAAGKYVEPTDRVQLRDKLLEYFKAIFGERSRLPSAEELDELLEQGNDRRLTPYELIIKLREMLESHTDGGDDAKT